MMRLLIALIAVLALGWSGYWLLGARQVDRALASWVQARDSDGWVAHAGTVKTQGFPNRFDTTFTDIELADPATGLAWTAPFFQILRLSYEPRHVIAIWPPQQTIATPDQRIAVATDSARGSLVFSPGGDWLLERASLVFDAVQLRSSAGWSAEFGQVLLASRPSERVPGAIDIGFDAKDIRPASQRLQRLARLDLLPGRFEYVSLDASVTFDAPWDRHAIETGRPNITALDLHVLKSKWGSLELWLAGQLRIDSQGRPTGRLTLKARNWREILDLLTGAGWIPDQLAGPLESGLDLVALLAGSSKTLDVPLTFRDGKMRLGPIPLGDAPRIHIR